MTTINMIETATFSGLVDLASERVGGEAVLASDEFFAGKENLLKSGRGVFIPDKYTDNGKWMDGWESRRKRVPGHDWCMIRLGLPGMIKGVDIDTNHFLGNHPPYASIDAYIADKTTTATDLASDKTAWTPILSRSPLRLGAQNLFSVNSNQRWTHVRLNIYPDGGVARFRVYGIVMPDWRQYNQEVLLDLAAIENGGQVTACSDMFFGHKENMIMPGRAANMGDGWETRRRRGPGHDWAILQLGTPGILEKIEVDTNHFKGNYPDRCSLDGCYVPGESIDAINIDQFSWQPLLLETKLSAHTRHLFEQELLLKAPVSHVRLNIFPDGGVSRLRLWGKRV